jgi:hypothetical protein
MYEGARSGTAEKAIADGIALVERGFEMVDVGAVAARSGPPVAAEDEIERLIPAIAGLAGRTDAAVSADTFVPGVATAVVVVIDPAADLELRLGLEQEGVGPLLVPLGRRQRALGQRQRRLRIAAGIELELSGL